MVARKPRLDAELVRRGLARSRQHAAELIAEGAVCIAGQAASKPATGVELAAPITVNALSDDGYVSRGAHKLIGALDHFADKGLEVAGRRCLDAGASTGGFTDVLLRRDAAHVVAVDVGYGQLAWRLRTDSRVSVVERTNVRSLEPATIGGAVQLTVADLSFISLCLVLPALAACTRPDGDIVPMIKPQFEVGREKLGSGGVVRDPLLWAESINRVIESAATWGWFPVDLAISPLPGPAGNREFFVWLRTGAHPLADGVLERVISESTGGM